MMYSEWAASAPWHASYDDVRSEALRDPRKRFVDVVATMRALTAAGLRVVSCVESKPISSELSPSGRLELKAAFRAGLWVPNFGIRTGALGGITTLTVLEHCGTPEYDAFCRSILRREGEKQDVFLQIGTITMMVYSYVGLKPGPCIWYPFRDRPVQIWIDNGAVVLGPGSIFGDHTVTIHGPGVEDGGDMVRNALALLRRQPMPPLFEAHLRMLQTPPPKRRRKRRPNRWRRLM
jgi:hypothetical protein